MLLYKYSKKEKRGKIMSDQEKFYMNKENGQAYKVVEDNDIAQFYFDDFVPDILSFDAGQVGDNVNIVDDFTENDLNLLYSLAYTPDELGEIKENHAEYMSDDIEERATIVANTTIPELVDYLEIEAPINVIRMLNSDALDEFMDNVEGVLSFEITGYSQGDYYAGLYPKNQLAVDRDDLEKRLQTYVYNSLNTIENVEPETLEYLDSLETLDAVDYSLIEGYTDKLDKYMLDNYNATPATVKQSLI